ncbi:MFS transporter [Nonomuraea soli]|uniref:MFS family permease n=1 Tax=Nonomuraea soli TaxID=1032476 RepID=A0A7W0HPN4_9ACTN|nr:MFS transporter [Nonomuraea soli]MBA2890771.1 MFS family permease [Nonomuraea soli]
MTADEHVDIPVAGRPPLRVRLDSAAPFGWWPAVCIALVAFIDRVEFNLMAGALPVIQRELGFGDTAGGAIASAAAVAGIILLIPAGRLADRGRRTWILAAVVGVWSLLTLGSGLVTTYAMLFTVRVMLGGAGLLYNPAGSSLLADYFPGSSRARAFALERFGYFAGPAGGVIAGGALAGLYGWRTMFFLVAVPGIVIALLCLTLREPARGTGDRIELLRTGEVPAAPEHVTPRGSTLREMRGLLTIRTLRAIVIGLSTLFFGLGGLMFWLPTFYARTFGLSSGAASAIAGSVGLVGMIAGALVSARLGDRWSHRRVTLGAIGLMIGALSLAASVAVPLLPVQLFFLGVANFGIMLAIPALTAAVADVVPAARRGLGFALSQFVVSLAGAFGPLLVGAASEATGSLRVAYALLAVPLVLGALLTLRGRSSLETDRRAALSALS